MTLFREDFHAKTLVPQEKEQELMESAAGCGEKWRASFTKYDPDSCSWKTHQCSLLEDLEPFLETWPQWGLMRDGECWEQRTLEQTIRGTEFGLLLPTPRSSMYQNRNWWFRKNPMGNLEELPSMYPNEFGHLIGKKINPRWLEWMMGWPIGWTEQKPLEMDKSHFVQQLHGKSFREEPK